MNSQVFSLIGTPASVGTAEGVVRIVRRLPVEDFPEGSILVAHTTDPTYLELLFRASAVVTEIGGRLCHTAIVAMELGIPCVVGAANACEILRDGDRVRIEVSPATATIQVHR